MKIICRLIFVVFLASNVNSQSQQTETTDLFTGGGCGRTSTVAGGVVTTFQPPDTLPPIANNFVCFFQMRAVRRNQKVRFRFTFFSLTPNNCSLSNLTFYDGTNATVDPQIALICPDTADVLTREYVSNGSWLTFQLQVSSGNSSTVQHSANFSGFYVSFTDNRNPCVDQSEELMCNNGRCIFNVLECDGLDSCGDNTDESTAAPTFCDRMNTALDSSAATGLFGDLTPLYIVLTIAFALLATYILYMLLSFQQFKILMMSCLYRCFLFGIRRNRKWRENKEKMSGTLSRKITPENKTISNLESPANDPVSSPFPKVVPPALIPPSSPVNNGASAVATEQKEKSTLKKSKPYRSVGANKTSTGSQKKLVENSTRSTAK